MANQVVVETRLKKTAHGLSFGLIAEAFNAFANVGSYIGEEYESFFRDHDLVGVPTVLMATHSMGGRSWTAAEGHLAAFFPEPCFNGGWDVIKEDDVIRLFADSATSGSSLTAERQRDSSWTLSLEVPLQEDGTPYHGQYWAAFHAAVGAPVVEPEPKAAW